MLLIGAGLAISGPAAAGEDLDCSDFPDQATAQRFYEEQGGPQSDPHNLDGDHDGVACESSPCPCADPGSGGGGGEPPGEKARARVLSIVDGDTIEVDFMAQAFDVRLIGMDTPEIGRCAYAKATRALSRQLEVGERVGLISDPTAGDLDRYGRLLRYVTDGDVDVGKRQVQRGWARVLVVGAGFGRQSSYERARRSARRADRGLWRKCGRFPA